MKKFLSLANSFLIICALGPRPALPPLRVPGVCLTIIGVRASPQSPTTPLPQGWVVEVASGLAGRHLIFSSLNISLYIVITVSYLEPRFQINIEFEINFSANAVWLLLPNIAMSSPTIRRPCATCRLLSHDIRPVSHDFFIARYYHIFILGPSGI